MLYIGIVAVILLFLLFYFYISRKQTTTPQAEGSFFQSSKGPIFYKLEGRGPVVLLIHGLGSSSYCWRHSFDFLKNHFTVVTIDLWGFGNSTKNLAANMTLDEQTQILIALMDFLKIKSFHVVGHSMGGHIALWLTRNHLNRVNKVVVIAPASHPQVVPKNIKKLSWLAHFTPWFFNKQLITKILKDVILDHSLINDEMIEAYFAPYQDPVAHISFAAAINMIRDKRVFDQLRYINKDVLILWGEQDHVIKRSIIELIHQQIPKSQLQTSPRSKHMPMEDDPDWLNKQILSFLKS